MTGARHGTGSGWRRWAGEMRRILPLLVACLLALASPGVTAAPTPTPAPGPAPAVAGLVISYGDGAFSYATIPLDGGHMDGMALLKASGLTVLAIDFGGYGQGVCKIEVVGCDISACRQRLCQTADRDSPFWRYLLAGDSGWVMSPLGATGMTAEAGRVYGWSWSGGGGAPPDMPLMTLDQVMARSGFDPESSPLHPAVRTTGRMPAAMVGPAREAYLGAAVILLVLGAGGIAVVRRASSRARTPAP